MSVQLPLGIGLHESASFENYIPGPNQAVYTVLQKMIAGQGEKCLYLWGGLGTGKSHLLQAACHYVASQGGHPAYLPLSHVTQASSAALESLENLENLDLVCLDDIHAIAGQAEWEQSLFHLFNRLHDNKVPQIISGIAPPNILNIHLADLASRLNWGGVFGLDNLAPPDKVAALQKHAKGRGLTLSVEVATYLVRHCPDEMPALVTWLDKLDYASLAARRKLTLPFVRRLLEKEGQLLR